ncbi:MAG: DUF2236 domain-containing protein [Gammaproteobacteria bacterium]|jgi:uncharacterized protein (DUF2236 family)|nr:DUF2236 domain-containing protein [Gammaproteobacteria bacterium]
MKRYMGWDIDFTAPRGEPAYARPGSVHWRVYKNPVALALGGVCAVLLEFADPRIRSGVWDHSVFPKDPLGRGQRTAMAAQIGVFGPRSAADQVTARIGKLHARVKGETPTGQAYEASDPELANWVSATASYGFAMAYHRFVAPLTPEEIDRFFADAVTVGRLYGALSPPTSLEAFYALCEAMTAGFEPHRINEEFLDIMRSGRAAPGIPRWLQSQMAAASISLLPPSVRTILALGPEYDLSRAGRLAVRTIARLAERVPQPKSPAAQASQRLGLPRRFPWLSLAKQRKYLEKQNLKSPEQRRQGGAELGERA